jgi:hypothetical protein
MKRGVLLAVVAVALLAIAGASAAYALEAVARCCHLLPGGRMIGRTAAVIIACTIVVGARQANDPQKDFDAGVRALLETTRGWS